MKMHLLNAIAVIHYGRLLYGTCALRGIFGLLIKVAASPGANEQMQP